MTAHELMDAVACLGRTSLPGHEVRLYKYLVERFPEAPEAIDAMRAMGLRLEQVDARDPAITAYAAYLRRYPKQADARALGQRAVCLARSLDDDDRADELLHELERLYARRGFSRPDAATLERLCAAPPTAPG